MTLADLMKAIDALSYDEVRRLRQYIEQRELEQKETEQPQAGTLDVDALFQVFDAMRAGLTEEELDEIVTAMNTEYIEPLDESEWDA